ncbi:hypothetical protein CDL15_Pgr008233 [Punica granatum]|uniref:Uncharacterized protein n=1 Tax=Punica granatum TaxID=22663 RepID=A0A218VUE2_PUNGR|nr:hypothetical protein CDL15_Pgr008233 [Punica granatum]
MRNQMITSTNLPMRSRGGEDMIFPDWKADLPIGDPENLTFLQSSARVEMASMEGKWGKKFRRLGAIFF